MIDYTLLKHRRDSLTMIFYLLLWSTHLHSIFQHISTDCWNGFFSRMDTLIITNQPTVSVHWIGTMWRWMKKR